MKIYIFITLLFANEEDKKNKGKRQGSKERLINFACVIEDQEGEIKKISARTLTVNYGNRERQEMDDYRRGRIKKRDEDMYRKKRRKEKETK